MSAGSKGTNDFILMLQRFSVSKNEDILNHLISSKASIISVATTNDHTQTMII